MEVGTLARLDATLEATASTRRRIAAALLMGEPVSAQERASLAEALSAIERLPGSGKCREIDVEDGRTIEIDFGFELEELRRDLCLLNEGEVALQGRIARQHPSLDTAIAPVLEALSPLTFHAFLTDRDGTFINYSGRYLTSVQPAYNALWLARFIHARTEHCFIVTSGPLTGPGVADLSVFPPGTVAYAASKGREVLDATGRRHEMPLQPAEHALLDALEARLRDLVAQPRFQIFSLIGSGLQRKFGEVTLARQDAAGSIPTEESEALLGRVRAIVGELDPGAQTLRIEDTGLDMEIALTVRDGPPAREFDKGDGVRLLQGSLGLDMAAGPLLVCGDTAADLAMLEAASAYAPETHAVFVTRTPELERKVRAVCPGAHCLPDADHLVVLLHRLGGRGAVVRSAGDVIKADPHE